MGSMTHPDSLRDEQHYIFPIVDLHLPRGIDLNFGPGFGLTRTSDQILTKFNAELEFDRLLGD